MSLTSRQIDMLKTEEQLRALAAKIANYAFAAPSPELGIRNTNGKHGA